MELVQARNFLSHVETAVAKVQQILDTTRKPVLPSEAAHEYSDKFALVERAGNNTVGAICTVLRSLGITQENLDQFRDAAQNGKVITLTFESEERCKFVRTVERKEESKVEHVSTFLGMENKSKTVTTIREHFWSFQQEYRILVVQGNDTLNAQVLLERKGQTEIFTVGDKPLPPHPESRLEEPKRVQISSLLAVVGNKEQSGFKINREDKKCYTPTENEQVTTLTKDVFLLSKWLSTVRHSLMSTYAKVKDSEKNQRSLKQPSSSDLFIPIVPMFGAMSSEEKEAKGQKTLVSLDDVDRFMAAHQNEVKAALRDISVTFPQPNDQVAGLMSAQESGIILLADHLQAIEGTFSSFLDYMRDLLHSQLVQAIGKEVTPEMVEEYMRFHYRKMFAGNVMRPFSFDIKREGYAPEGTLSIEDKSASKEIQTCVMERAGGEAVPMSFRLNASTRVEMQGPQFVHGYLSHQFRNSPNRMLQLVARARQFSTFVLLVGRIAAKDEFEPKHAIILQNKDTVLIPLLLDPLPTAKAFRDAIESLSPEQQDFAKAIRAMQLESTLFAVGLVEIKPQLELLLKLPDGGLTKEIKLTQDLVKLFIEYQVPCDLLTYDGDEDAPLADKIARVRRHADTLLEMIDGSRKEDLKEAQDRAVNNIYGAVEDSLSPEYYSMPRQQAQMAPPQQMLRKAQAMPLKSMSVMRGRATVPKPVSFSASSLPNLAPTGSSFPGVTKNEVVQKDERENPMQDLEIQGSGEEGTGVDYTRIPAQLDARVETLDTDAALRPTKISCKGSWNLHRFRNLISQTADETYLDKEELSTRKNKAMDLLDALSRSGDLPLKETQLHVILASTHCFDDTVMDCVLKKNMNPLDKIERSSLIIASCILGKRPAELVCDVVRPRIQAKSPNLFLSDISS